MGWTSAFVQRSIETLSGFFSLIVVDDTKQKLNNNWPLQTQDECVIRINNDVLITGYIDSVQINISEESHVISIRGRDKTCDLIDCSATNKPGKYAKINIFNFAEVICSPFGITVKAESGVDLTKTFKASLNPGESAFEALDKKAKELGILIITDGLGNLVLGNNDRTELNDPLVYGQNIKNARASYDYTDRFSYYRVETQGSSSEKTGWDAKVGVFGEGHDDGVNRYRPLIIRGESQMTSAFAQRTAQWEALVRAAKSQIIDITVQGFRQSNGELWEINKLVDVHIPPCYVNPPVQLLVTSVSYELSENGSFTKMTLMREDAYTSQPIQRVPANNNLGWG